MYALYSLTRCLTTYLFTNSNSDRYLAGKSLLSNSFRIGTNFWDSWSIYFRRFGKVALCLLNSKPSFRKYSAADVWIYDNSPKDEKLRLQFIEMHSNDRIGGSVYRETLLYSAHFGARLLNLALLFLLFVGLIPIWIFTENKSCTALIFNEFFEITNLVYILKTNGAKSLYFFCIFEKDANLTHLVLNKFGIETRKITSETPLAFWNKIILTDTLILCFEYQTDEAAFFKDTIRYKLKTVWSPETAPSYISKYSSSTHKTTENKNVIGFYSTGNWIKSERGETLESATVLDEENNLKTMLSEYLKLNSSLELKIYLHPKEKSSLALSDTKAHYQSYFGMQNYSLANLDQPTSFLFDEINIAVSLFSTIVLERIYFGFKTIIMPLSYTNFPIQPSGLYNISVFSQADLFAKIDDNLNLTNGDFFFKYGLQNYTKHLD